MRIEVQIVTRIMIVIVIMVKVRGRGGRGAVRYISMGNIWHRFIWRGVYGGRAGIWGEASRGRKYVGQRPLSTVLHTGRGVVKER